MDSFDDNGWDLLDYSSFIDEVTSTDLYWGGQSADVQVDDSLTVATTQDEEYTKKGCPRKRTKNDSCRLGTKACRERLRRERLNESFLELSLILEPERPPKTDKFAILGNAIRVLNQLQAESQEFKETHEKLLEEIKALKAEKNELREEKLVLKEEKERTEQRLKAMTASLAGFLPPHPAYHAGVNKMAVFPSYGYVPMWQYLPPATLDTSKDQELRPPAA
ncbi:Transcription factor bHLH104 like [Actinidia chinensis var. chinensis]|uniref:Transcription factor bHLH104 like n=1 Tax=Actinidia chinensis var. chinensis TaxID=1590841 RepID=A0A2R6RXZ4_ACTCC|nr:Transcription factor bHLH104 like [Actinidia chinensis var. chinensis]